MASTELRSKGGRPAGPAGECSAGRATCCLQESEQRINGCGRGVARHAATGLKNSDGKGTCSDGNSRTAKWSSTSVQQQRTLRSVTVPRPAKLQRDGKLARAAVRCHVIFAESVSSAPGPRPPWLDWPAESCDHARRRLVSESVPVPRTCRIAGVRHSDWLGPCRIRVTARPQARGQCEDALVAVVPLHIDPARSARPVDPRATAR